MQGTKIYRKAFVVYISFIGVLLITLLPLSRIALDALTQQALKASQEVLTAGLTRLEGELDRIYQVASALYADPQMCTLASIDVYKRQSLDKLNEALVRIRRFVEGL